MCANFIYDLNGKKGPNTVGKDIGFMTALYSIDPIVAAPEPYPSDLPEGSDQTSTVSGCRELDDNLKLPNKDELTSLFCNKSLINFRSNEYWSSTVISNTEAIMQGSGGGRKPSLKSIVKSVRCIKK